MSEGVSAMSNRNVRSKQTSEWWERTSKRKKRVTQYSNLYSWLFWPTVQGQRKTDRNRARLSDIDPQSLRKATGSGFDPSPFRADKANCRKMNKINTAEEKMERKNGRKKKDGDYMMPR